MQPVTPDEINDPVGRSGASTAEVAVAEKEVLPERLPEPMSTSVPLMDGDRVVP
jgi:hypothetical protein